MRWFGEQLELLLSGNSEVFCRVSGGRSELVDGICGKF